MGQASSSSASTSGIQSSGGNITNNPPNYGPYILAALALVILAYLVVHRRKR